jgi:hypothetical protein
MRIRISKNVDSVWMRIQNPVENIFKNVYYSYKSYCSASQIDPKSKRYGSGTAKTGIGPAYEK